MQKYKLFYLFVLCTKLVLAQQKYPCVIGLGLQIKSNARAEDFTFEPGLNKTLYAVTKDYTQVTPSKEKGTMYGLPLTMYFEYPKFILYASVFLGKESYEINFMGLGPGGIGNQDLVLISGEEVFTKYYSSMGIARAIHLDEGNRWVFLPSLSFSQNFASKNMVSKIQYKDFFYDIEDQTRTEYVRFGIGFDFSLNYRVSNKLGVGITYPQAIQWYVDLYDPLKSNLGNNKNFDLNMVRVPDFRVLYFINYPKN